MLLSGWPYGAVMSLTTRLVAVEEANKTEWDARFVGELACIHLGAVSHSWFG